MNTRERFRLYIDLEKMVAEKVRELADFGGTISRIVPVEEGLGYDRVVVLEGGREIKLEIQISEARDWQRYHDVRLDLISAFRRSPESPFFLFGRIYPNEVDDFLDSIEVRRYGKLYPGEAETLAFYVRKPVDLLWIYSMEELRKYRDYFTHKYGIYINFKSHNETWDSCFVPVPERDPFLDRCGLRYELGGGE